MSYDIVRSLSINIDKKRASGSSASNNVFPKDFERWEYTHKDVRGQGGKNFTGKELFLGGLLRHLDGGNMQMTSSVGVKYRFSLLKIREYEEKKYGEGIYQTLNKLYQVNGDKKTVYQIKDIINKYEELLKLKDRKIKVVAILDNGNYYNKHSSRSIWSSPHQSDAKVITSEKEKEVLRATQSKIREFVKV